MAVLSLGTAPALAGEATASSTTRGLERLEQEGRAQPHQAAVLARPLAEARRALRRAAGARAAGDDTHGATLELLAADFLELATTLSRALRAETDAKKEVEASRERQTKLLRARALLAEQQARRGRVAAEVERLERERAASPPAAPAQPPAHPDRKGAAAARSGDRAASGTAPSASQVKP